jgi:hypothetical protein
MRSITVQPLDEIQKPSFEYREPYFAEASDPDWAARNRANGTIMKLDAERGGKVQYYPFVHSFEQLVPPSKYFAEHPEYFSLIDGKRRSERSQLCLTNPAVLRIGVESVERWIAEHPEATIISVSQNDWTGWCECDNCQRVEQEEGGVHSGPLLRYVNALAEQIEKKHPDKLIDTLAYWYTEDPPAHVRPRRNVRVRLCPIGACVGHPYRQCKYDAYFVKNLEAWSKITNQLYIWHYNTNFAHYLAPFPDFDELMADLPMYRDHGVVGVFLEGNTSRAGGGENAELRDYIMARLLWDTKVDAKRDLDEFHEAYYGKAAKPMRAYFDLMHEQVRMPPNGLGHHLWIFDRPSAPYLNDEFLTKATVLFQQAESAADTDDIRNRVRKARLSLDYVKLTRAKKFIVDGDSFRPNDLDGLKDRWNTFTASVERFGITNLSEHVLVPKDREEFASHMHPYKLATLENDRLKIHVLPELGRVIHLIDKRSGKDLLQEPEPGSRFYPDLGGLTVAAYSDYVARPWNATWSIAPEASAGAITLAGVCENGLRMRRTLRLEGAFLRTETVLENGSQSPLEALVRSSWDVDPGSLESAAVTYRKQDGGMVEKALIVPEKQPNGTEYYSGGDQPDGLWRVAGRSGVPAGVNRFPKDQVGRCFLNWTAKSENRVTMSVASHRKVLQPGERLTLEADYGVE